ncbi:hypothetical protein Tco_0210183 [Tanacetum coccineum]
MQAAPRRSKSEKISLALRHKHICKRGACRLKKEFSACIRKNGSSKNETGGLFLAWFVSMAERGLFSLFRMASEFLDPVGALEDPPFVASLLDIKGCFEEVKGFLCPV